MKLTPYDIDTLMWQKEKVENELTVLGDMIHQLRLQVEVENEGRK